MKKNARRGQGLAEYGLIAVLVGLVCFLSLENQAESTLSLYYRVENDVTAIAAGSYSGPGEQRPSVGGGETGAF